jgi:hypothetical protein
VAKVKLEVFDVVGESELAKMGESKITFARRN